MSTRRERAKAQRTQLNKQLETHKKRQDEKNDNLIELGKYFYTLSSLTFGGAILTVLLEYEEERKSTLLASIIVMTIFGIIGWLLIQRGNLKYR